MPSVIIEEQGLRDGLQTLPQVIPTATKLQYIDRLVAAGIRRIQVASFVHPRLVPQMADAEEVCRQLNRKEGVIYSGLVLNEKGVERGIAAGLDHLALSISASDTHSQKNARKTLEEARTSFRKMVQLAKANAITIRGGIQCAFGCRFEGEIASSHVLDMVKVHLDEGVDELALADSTGMANPQALYDLMAQVMELSNGLPVLLHLHNTESKGLANVFAALQAGVRYFDTAFGGLGGCPFIKSASGNIATEDTANMLEQMGYDTGLDLSAIATISQEMAEALGYQLPGQLYQLLQKSDIKMI